MLIAKQCVTKCVGYHTPSQFIYIYFLLCWITITAVTFYHNVVELFLEKSCNSTHSHTNTHTQIYQFAKSKRCPYRPKLRKFGRQGLEKTSENVETIFPMTLKRLGKSSAHNSKRHINMTCSAFEIKAHVFSQEKYLEFQTLFRVCLFRIFPTKFPRFASIGAKVKITIK